MPPAPPFCLQAGAPKQPRRRPLPLAATVSGEVTMQASSAGAPRPGEAAALDRGTLEVVLDEALQRQTGVILLAVQQQMLGRQGGGMPGDIGTVPPTPARRAWEATNSPALSPRRRPRLSPLRSSAQAPRPSERDGALPTLDQVPERVTRSRTPQRRAGWASPPRSRVAPTDVGSPRPTTPGLRSQNFTELYKQIVVQDDPYVSAFQDYINQGMMWWKNLGHAQSRSHALRTSRCLILLDEVVQSYAFQALSMLLIAVNMAFMAFEVDRGMSAYGQKAFQVGDEQKLFLVLYLTELVLRMVSGGRFFFIGKDMQWNWFDLVVILGHLISELWVGSSSQAWMRIWKCFRIANVGRGLKILTMFGLRDLGLMVKQVYGSFVSLVWCSALLAFITFLFALFFMYSLLCLPPAVHASDELVAEFGSVGSAFVTLLQATTGGVDWGDIYEHLHDAGEHVAVAFIAYILFYVIALWNIVTATFVDKMVKMTKLDTEESELRERLEELEEGIELRELFSEVDLDGSNYITEDELQKCLEQPSFRQYLATRGVHFKEACAFFAMLFETGIVKELHVDALVAYCRRIKGTASSLDLHTMRYEFTTLLQMQEERLLAMDELLRQSWSVHMGGPVQAHAGAELSEEVLQTASRRGISWQHDAS